MWPHEGSTPANDIGSYAVQFALWVSGERPTEIIAAGDKNEDGCDLWASIILKFPSKTKATLFYSAVDNSPNSAYVSFTDGHIEVCEFSLLQFLKPVSDSWILLVPR